jgi:hypothetical protein
MLHDDGERTFAIGMWATSYPVGAADAAAILLRQKKQTATVTG